MKMIVAVCSSLIWGSGQLINKQKGKALIFFFLQCIFVGIELLSGTLDLLLGRVDQTFRNAGFFTKGLWGLITLGEIPRTSSAVKVYDHSVILLITGLIATVILFCFVLIWIWNIRDAYKTRVLIEQGETVSSSQYFKQVWTNSFEYIMITPGIILVVMISIIPILFSILIAFTNYNTNTIPPKNLIDWVGFQTFLDIVTIPIWGQTFVKVFTWTVIWAFLAAFTSYAFGMLQAVLINAKAVKGKSVFRGIYILAWAVPGLVSLLVFRAMFNKEGAFNQMLLGWGVISAPIPFLSDPMWAKTVLVLVNIWLGFPYFMALISGVMTAISPEIYEASEIDGANGLQKFKVISFPIIIASTAPQLIMSVTHNFNNFGMIYFLTEGGPPDPNLQMAGSTDILITWIFKLTLDQRMYNYASAISIFIFMIVASVSAFNLLRTRAFRED